MGMWVFLVTEILFFGGLFGSYIVYRALYHDSFEIGSNLLNVKFGATNTIVLIGSSLTMALAIHAAQAGKKAREQMMWLLLTILLGAIFLFLKFRFEWTADYHEHLIPGFGFVIRPEWRAARPARSHILLLLFLHDRLARNAHDRGHPDSTGDDLDGLAQHIQRELQRAARKHRPLLALRRYRLDFSVPASVLGGRPYLSWGRTNVGARRTDQDLSSLIFSH